jgi:hypothetical protein
MLLLTMPTPVLAQIRMCLTNSYVHRCASCLFIQYSAYANSGVLLTKNVFFFLQGWKFRDFEGERIGVDTIEVLICVPPRITNHMIGLAP